MNLPAQAQAERPISGSRASARVNDLAAALVVILVHLAAIPQASAHPVFPLIWSGLAGFLLAGHSLALARVAPGRPTRITRIRGILLAGLAVPLAALVQTAAAGLLPPADFAGHAVLQGSLAPGASLLGAFRQLGYAALFVVAYQVAARPSRARAMAWGLFAGVALNAVWALVALKALGDIAPLWEKTAYSGMATGTFVNRNAFATHLGIGLIIGLILLFDRALGARKLGRPLSERGAETGLFLLVLATVALALVETRSRMGLVACLGGVLAVVLALVANSTGIQRRKRLRGVFVVFALSIGGVALWGQPVLERVVFAAGDAGTRLELYRQVADMIAARPLLGVGLDTFPVAFELVHMPTVSGDVVWMKAHSTYLALWAEMGLVVGSLPILAGILAGAQLVTVLRRRGAGHALAASALGALVLSGLHATLDFSLEVPANAMLLVVLLALGLGSSSPPERGGTRHG